MIAERQLDRAATAAAEEVLRVIYGDDLQGCAVSLDEIAGVIRAAFEAHARTAVELAELHMKAFEAVQLLATPPADGKDLLPEDLRSLLGERLDKIRDLASKVRGASTSAPEATLPPPPANDGTPDL
jgi:hypothetical protein